MLKGYLLMHVQRHTAVITTLLFQSHMDLCERGNKPFALNDLILIIEWLVTSKLKNGRGIR